LGGGKAGLVSPHRKTRRFSTLTVFDTTNVADDDLFDTELDRLTITDHSELMLFVDSPLESAELDFLAPVVERCYRDNDDNGDDDC
jgi:hypothetical protein